MGQPDEPADAGRPGASDVDELVEVLDEVVDEPLAGPRGRPPGCPGRGVEGDGRDHQAALASWPATAGARHQKRTPVRFPDRPAPVALRKSARTRSTPRRLATSRISSAAQMSTGRPLLGRAGRGTRWDRPTVRSLPRCLLRGWDVRRYARPGPSMPTATGSAGPGSAAPAGPPWPSRAASRDPSGQSLNRSLSQRPNGPGGSTSGASARSASSRLARRSWRRDGRPVRPPGRRRSARRPGPGPGRRSAASSCR